MRFLYIFLWLSISIPSITIAQDTKVGEVRVSSVLTIDISRIARETQYGQRVFKDFEKAQSELVENNTTIQNNLEAEEQSLVELRKTLAADEFRKLALEFDERANSIRKERSELENTLFETRDEKISELLRLSIPFLQEIMLSYKANVIVDRRNVVLSNPMIDITEKAIKLIDDNLGDGAKSLN